MQTNEDTIFPKETSHTVKVSVGVEASKEQLVINEVVAFDVGSADSGQNNEAWIDMDSFVPISEFVLAYDMVLLYKRAEEWWIPATDNWNIGLVAGRVYVQASVVVDLYDSLASSFGLEYLYRDLVHFPSYEGNLSTHGGWNEWLVFFSHIPPLAIVVSKDFESVEIIRADAALDPIWGACADQPKTQSFV